MAVPKHVDLFNPLLTAMHNLGGSGSIQEQEDEVAKILGLSEDEASEIHKGNRTKLSYNLAWARNNLKHFGLLENSSRGVWALTPQGRKTIKVDKNEVRFYVAELNREKRKSSGVQKEDSSVNGTLTEDDTIWEDQLLECVRSMSPAAFERLTQRLLRESGFIQVEVTGQSGDGGIDGKGVVRVGGLISFHMIFQCKRFAGSVGASVIRDFRGAMVGRADKGLLITTGTFTADARREAQRDGAPPLDLIDGKDLVQKLKEFRLGVKVTERIVEDVAVVPEYFEDV